MKIIVDLDGIICSNTNGKYNEAIPDDDEIKRINFMHCCGTKIIIQTGRKVEKRFLTEVQLETWGVKYHELIMGKVTADWYIDDRGKKSMRELIMDIRFAERGRYEIRNGEGDKRVP